MRKLIIGLVAGAVLATTAVAVAAPKPTTTTSTTTTTTLPPAPPQPTRGVLDCPAAGSGTFTDWIQMGEHTQVVANGFVTGQTELPRIEVEFSADGANVAFPGSANQAAGTLGGVSGPQANQSAWPYVRVRCINVNPNPGVIVWKLT